MWIAEGWVLKGTKCSFANPKDSLKKKFQKTPESHLQLDYLLFVTVILSYISERTSLFILFHNVLKEYLRIVSKQMREQEK